MMKKKLMIALIFMFITFSSSYAGSFYSNISILGSTTSRIVEVLKQMGLMAILIKGKNNIHIVCEKKLDSQDDDYGRNLTQKLSQKLRAISIYFLNHDSDILLCSVYSNGEQYFNFNSCPGYFDGDDIPPLIIGLERLPVLFPSIDVGDLKSVLVADEVFADDLHQKLAKYLGLPEETLTMGYQIIKSNDTDEVEKYFHVEIITIE